MVCKRGRSSGSSHCPSPKKARSEERLTVTDGLMLRLKIQRLRGEDFFVSIGGKDLVTQLKEQVLQILKSGDGSEVWAEVTNLRLIYKGKFLLDAKSIEFYKIQNDDTIQLAPSRRRRNAAQSSSRGPNPALSPRRGDAELSQPDLGGLHLEAWRGPFAFMSISTSITGGLPRIRVRRSHRINIQQQREVNHRHRQRGNAPFPIRPRRSLISRSLRRFKAQLQTTLTCVTAMERRGSSEGGRDLAIQLSGIIRGANSLRTQLLRMDPPSVFAATEEEGVFSRVERKQDNELASNLNESERRGAIVPFHGTSRSTPVSVSLGRSSPGLRRLSAMNILANQEAARQRHPGHRRRRFTTARMMLQRDLNFRPRRRNYNREQLNALVASPIRALFPSIPPIVSIRISEVPRRGEQFSTERSSANDSSNSNPSRAREDSRSRSSTNRTSPGGRTDIIEITDSLQDRGQA